MHDFPSDAFGRPITLQELPFWSQVDLQTLRSELKARLKEINAKIDHHKARGIFNKRELNARTYLQIFHNKAHEELQNHGQDQRLDKLEKELHAARRQLKEEKEAHNAANLVLQYRMLKFQTLLGERFGKDVIQEIAEETNRLTANE